MEFDVSASELITSIACLILVILKNMKGLAEKITQLSLAGIAVILFFYCLLLLIEKIIRIF